MSLVEATPPATLPDSIPDAAAPVAEQPSYNSPGGGSSSPDTQSTTSTTTEDDVHPTTPVIDDDDTHITEEDDDMMSIHSSKSDTFALSSTAPALPAKSSLRASRLLATLPQKLPQDRPVLTHAAPHIVYLSSEEDASSSAEDLSDLEGFESDSELGAESLDGRDSREDTARLVSVVFSGKPSMITLPSRSSTRSSLSSQDSQSHFQRTCTEPTLGRKRSISSTLSSFHHPPRSSSMITSAFEKRRPKFLHVDPFAHKSSDKETKEVKEAETQKTPKTPTAMFTRAFHLVKKRSKPTLNGSMPREAEHMEQVGEEDETKETPSEQRPATSHAPASSVSYNDIMKAAKRNAQVAAASPPTPTSPKSGKDRRGFSISQRMSIRV
ncbi:hypothetical protein K4F52_001017 [Lecanicillium sp. MT-2017a]|nr:hypothetical protein K4F52_001017 [Lecanicillium sp. MT-2017a]